MDTNFIIFILGCVIVSGSLLLTIFQNKSKSSHKSFIESANKFNNSVNLTNKLTSDIEYLKKEVTLVKKELLTVFDILNTNIMVATTESENEIKVDNKDISFSNILNYSKFISNNKDIVDRYKSNKSIEEIAKELNKSIREVEMVTKLIK